MCIWSTALAVPPVCGPVWAAVDFNHFQTIIDRKPFGSEVSPQAPGTGPDGVAANEEPFVKALKISAFVRDKETGVLQVGLVNTKPAGSYLMVVGQTEDGVTLVAADYEREKVALRQDGKTFWLSMDGTATPYTVENASINAAVIDAVPSDAANTAVPDDAGDEAPVVAQPANNQPSPVRTAPTPTPPGVLRSGAATKYNYRQHLVVPMTGADGRKLSYTERKKMRDAMFKKLREKNSPESMVATDTSATSVKASDAEKEPAGEAETATVDPEMDKAIQDYQMQAIREGRQALPVPLSPESDAQLVREGYLPAQ